MVSSFPPPSFSGSCAFEGAKSTPLTCENDHGSREGMRRLPRHEMATVPQQERANVLGKDEGRRRGYLPVHKSF